MLEIYVHGPVMSGFLEMQGEAQLDMEYLQPAFDMDMNSDEFSLPFDIPYTEWNRMLLGFPERITNFNHTQNYYRCNVYDQGVPEMQNAKLTLLGKSGTLTYHRGVFNASVSGTRGLFGAAIKNKSLRDVDYGPAITWTGKSSREFATEHAEADFTAEWEYDKRILFAPVAIENFIDKERADYDNEFLVKDCVNYVLGVSGTQDFSTAHWSFDRPKSAAPAEAATPADPEYRDYRTVPFIKVQHVVRCIFSHFGYELTGDWIDDMRFDRLLLFNNRAIEVYNVTSNQDTNRRITLRNHVPDRRVSEFLKSLFGFFGIFPVFGSDNKVRLVYRKTNLANKTIASLTPYLVDAYDSSYGEGQQQQGYKLDYEWDSNEGYHSDRVREHLDGKTLVATVQHRSELDALDIGRQLTTDDIAYVEKEGMWYQLANATTTPLRWNCIAENLNDYSDGEADNAVTFAISPLPQYVENDPGTATQKMMPYAGTRMKGSYTNNKGALVQNPYGLHLFYATYDVVKNYLMHPISHNRPWALSTTENIDTPVYSLAWQGADGMAANFHKQWQDLLRNKERVTFTLFIDRAVLQLLHTHNTFEVNGTLFVPEMIEREMPMGNTARVRMVAL